MAGTLTTTTTKPTWTNEQVAAYYRDNNITGDAAKIAQANSVFGVSEDQSKQALSMLSSGGTAGIDAASDNYYNTVEADPSKWQQDVNFYYAPKGTGTAPEATGGPTGRIGMGEKDGYLQILSDNQQAKGLIGTATGGTTTGGTTTGGTTTGGTTTGGTTTGGTTTGGLIGSATNKAVNPPNEYQKPAINTQVDPRTMTIEGRIQNLLAVDPRGGYTNPVIRQAADRAMAAFAQRGLLNSSMAQEAAMEAAIAKAIEIAGPDAQTYFKQQNINQDWTNRFAENKQGQDFAQQNAQLQQDYKKELLALEQSYSTQNVDKQQSFALQQNFLQGISNLQGQYNNNIQAIQSSSMSAEEKSMAIQDLTNLFAGQKQVLSAAFQAMPQWKQEWSDSWNVSTGSSTPTSQNTGAWAPINYGGKTYAAPTDISDTELTTMLTALVNDTTAVTDEQYAALVAEAQKRGLTVG